MNSDDFKVLCVICAFVILIFCIIVTGTEERIKTECVMRVSIHKQNLTADEISKLCGVSR
jgi:hypothetical protein